MEFNKVYKSPDGEQYIVIDTGRDIRVCHLRPRYIIGKDCKLVDDIVTGWLKDCGLEVTE